MTIALATAMLASPALAMQGVTLVDRFDAIGANNLGSDYNSGVCRVLSRSTDAEGERLGVEFSRRLRDGNMAVQLFGPFMRNHRDKNPDDNYPMTVRFDGGATQPSRSGGYDVGGFRSYAWGGWGAGPTSDAAYAALKDAGSFTVEFDGTTYGPFEMPEKGALYSALDDCEIENS